MRTDETATERIVEAGAWAFAHLGLRKATMNAIAERAGLGVATLYRRFPRRELVLEAVLTREAEALIAEVDAAIGHLDGVEETLTHGFVSFVRAVHHRPLIRMLLREDSSVTLADLASGEAVLALGRGYLAAQIRRWQEAGELPAYDADLVAEILARLAESLVLTPGGLIPIEDEDAARAFARRYLLPLAYPRPE